jgi:hypothetical protein
MNTRFDLECRLQEIKRTAAGLPEPDGSIAEIHYQLTRLSNWTIRTLQFTGSIDSMKPSEEKNTGKLLKTLTACSANSNLLLVANYTLKAIGTGKVKFKPNSFKNLRAVHYRSHSKGILELGRQNERYKFNANYS